MYTGGRYSDEFRTVTTFTVRVHWTTGEVKREYFGREGARCPIQPSAVVYTHMRVYIVLEDQRAEKIRSIRFVWNATDAFRLTATVFPGTRPCLPTRHTRISRLNRRLQPRSSANPTVITTRTFARYAFGNNNDGQSLSPYAAEKWNLSVSGNVAGPYRRYGRANATIRQRFICARVISGTRVSSVPGIHGIYLVNIISRLRSRYFALYVCVST